MADEEPVPQHAEFAIRQATSDDAEMLAALASRLFTQAYAATHPKPELSGYLARSFEPRKLTAELEDPGSTVLIAEDTSSQPIGYAFLRESRPPATADVGGKCPVEIVRFYVEQTWHGRGLAQELMARCVDEAERGGSDVLWLAVWQKAPRPQAFYRKMGFGVVGATMFHFGARVDDDFVMARPLSRGSTRQHSRKPARSGRSSLMRGTDAL